MLLLHAGTFAIAAGLANAASISCSKSQNPVVDLGYTQYKGTRNNGTGITTWFGMRYAAPPIGENRWRPPLPIEANGSSNQSTVQDATSQGPSCVQGMPAWFDFPTVLGEEDCLTIDVNVPNHPNNASLPVWVEIHGGGYTIGNASYYPGFAMVNQSRGGLIFVQVQYRLGAYGFLNNAEVRANGTANAGLLDQRLALEWVQNHISAFGGDPCRVTIHGGSAGGGSVANQLIMHGGVADPPFRAAIAEYPWWQPYHNETVLEYQFQDLLSNTGCQSLSCLRQVPSSSLANATQLTYDNGYYGVPNGHPAAYGYGDFYYGPSVDGEIIQALPSVEFAQGHFSKVPLLTNRETYEGFVFTNLSITTASETMSDLRQLWQQGSNAFFEMLYQLYPSGGSPSEFNRTQDVFGDAFINCASWQIVTALTNAGQPTWKQIFNAGSQDHGATVPFLFGESADGTVTASSNSTLSLIMKDWFISFATHLDPNAMSYSGVPKPSWPQYGAQDFVMMANQSTLQTGADPDRNERCAFFANHGSDILN